METRKIQKTGGSTYVVSLPKKWIQRERLGKGSLLNIEEQKNNALLISHGPQKEPGKKEIEVSATSDIRRHITEKYLLGYDIIKIKFGKKQKTEIKKFLKNLMGLEIVEETSDTIIVHYLLDKEEVSLLKSMRRMHTIVSVMLKDIIAALETGDKNLPADVVQRDSEVNKLYFLLVRQIRTLVQNPALQDKEGISSVDCIDYRLVVKIIENIGDNLARIAELLRSGKNIPAGKELQETAQLCLEIYKNAFEALLKKDVQLAINARDLRQKLKKEKAARAKNSEIINLFLKIADSGKDLADIVVGE